MNINELPWLDKIFNKINFNNLSHGIILNGPEGIGKSILAKEISKKLIVKEDDFKSTNLFNLNTHPDFFLLNKDKTEKIYIPPRFDGEKVIPGYFDEKN